MKIHQKHAENAVTSFNKCRNQYNFDRSISTKPVQKVELFQYKKKCTGCRTLSKMRKTMEKQPCPKTR